MLGDEPGRLPRRLDTSPRMKGGSSASPAQELLRPPAKEDEPCPAVSARRAIGTTRPTRPVRRRGQHRRHDRNRGRCDRGRCLHCALCRIAPVETLPAWLGQLVSAFWPRLLMWWALCSARAIAGLAFWGPSVARTRSMIGWLPAHAGCRILLEGSCRRRLTFPSIPRPADGLGARTPSPPAGWAGLRGSWRYSSSCLSESPRRRRGRMGIRAVMCWCIRTCSPGPRWVCRFSSRLSWDRC